MWKVFKPWLRKFKQNLKIFNSFQIFNKVKQSINLYYFNFNIPKLENLGMLQTTTLKRNLVLRFEKARKKRFGFGSPWRFFFFSSSVIFLIRLLRESTQATLVSIHKPRVWCATTLKRSLCRFSNTSTSRLRYIWYNRTLLILVISSVLCILQLHDRVVLRNHFMN